MQNLSDTDLIQMLVDGDDSVFPEIVRRYEKIVRGKALKILKRESLVEEAVQDVFTSIYCHISKYNPEYGQLGQYISKIAQNQSIKILSREKLEILEDDENNYIDGDFQAKLEQKMFEERRSAVLHSALSHLSEADQELLSLHYGEGESYTSIAKKRKCPDSTIRNQADRAKEKLFQMLSKFGDLFL